jgi:SpoVK/Ycf46/Vps4 family AAA+-type ATPase
MAQTTESKSLAAIRDAIDAHRPLVYLQTSEEQRVEDLLATACETCFETRPTLFTWSTTEGLRQDGKPAAKQPDGPREVLDLAVAHAKPAIFLLKDFHEYLSDRPDIRRRLRDIYCQCLDRGTLVVIASPVKIIPEEINREVLFLTLTIPDLGELQTLLQREGDRLQAGGQPVELDDDALYVLARALQGLTYNEARHAIRRATARNQPLNINAVQLLREEKRLLVRKTGLLEYVPEAIDIDQVGGLETLKNWLLERRQLFRQRQSISDEIVPKGLLMMGVSGCGKSLSVKAVASVFELPLYRVDMIQIFSGQVGNPERAFVETCKTMEEIAPAVMWIDEIEMAISSSAAESTGALGRIFGFFLTWMQEKPAGLFVAATANRIDLLPAEMIRKGRFDQVFFIDLPTSAERIEIFKIHLAKRGVEPGDLNLDRMTRYTEGWTGAEIEQCVVAALVSAKLNDRPPGDDDLLLACRQIVPISKTMKEQVSHIRSWAFERALRASPK